MRKALIGFMAAVLLVLGAAPALGHDAAHSASHDLRSDLARAAKATARYHWLPRALREGFVPFAIPEEVGGTLLEIRGEDITCFDSPDGGMGVHYVRNIDDVLDPADPEALVYEVGRHGKLRLVALEYIIPEDLVDPAAPPMLFGRMMHHHAYLPVYILHVWIWKSNPDGKFADFNPRVKACPPG